MRFGLKQSVIDQLTCVFKTHSGIIAVYMYGSRATQNYKKTSDIDLSVDFDGTPQAFSKLVWDLENLNIIYKIDVLNYRTITDENLKSQIDQTGQLLYAGKNDHRDI